MPIKRISSSNLSLMQHAELLNHYQPLKSHIIFFTHFVNGAVPTGATDLQGSWFLFFTAQKGVNSPQWRDYVHGGGDVVANDFENEFLRSLLHPMVGFRSQTFRLRRNFSYIFCEIFMFGAINIPYIYYFWPRRRKFCKIVKKIAPQAKHFCWGGFVSYLGKLSPSFPESPSPQETNPPTYWRGIFPLLTATNFCRHLALATRKSY